MDLKLLAWGLRRRSGPLPRFPHPRFPLPRFPLPGYPLRRSPLPRLWLFTDRRRLADPRASVAALPRGRAGVVFRHDDDPARARLVADLARICRARRLVLVVAGDVRLAASVRAGVHLRGGRWPGTVRCGGVLTSSAHSVADLRRARAAGADLVFLSPAFATATHPGAPGLNPLRWAALARTTSKYRTRSVIAALGGVDGRTIARLPPRLVQAAGAIAALSQP